MNSIAGQMKVMPSCKPGHVLVEVGDKDEQILADGAAIPAPFQLKRILVPTDFSDCSKKALQYAIPFAKQFGASLTLLNVVQVSYPAGEFGPMEPPIVESELAEAAQKQLDGLIIQEIAGHVQATAQVRFGRPTEEIVLTAQEQEVDLIIISTHGHTGLKHVLLGSTAEQVVRRAPCPVLTVREHEHDFVPAG